MDGKLMSPDTLLADTLLIHESIATKKCVAI